MQQISPPLRIALIAVLLLAVLWFVALRPKSDDAADAPLPAPPTQGLSNAVTDARNATDAANDAVSTAEKATGGADAQTTTPPSTTTTPPSETAQTGSGGGREASDGFAEQAAVIAALDRGAVVVLVFRNTSSASSAVVRAAGDAVAGRESVVLNVASIGQVGAYPDFTTPAKVAQAPTVLVIGPSRRARTIVGYTTSAEIAQAIGDVRRPR